MTAPRRSPDPAASLSPHTRLGPYEILEPIGAGGMGEVYRARDTRLDRLVAVKVLSARIARDSNARARFEREARAIAALNHPNICAVHDVGHSDGRDFLVMELLEGETLHQRLARGPLPVAELVDLGLSLADALDAAHARGIVHRDLKPANVFLTSKKQPKILDFGVAKVVSASDDTTRQADDLTARGAAAGTIGYMSPEQLRGEALDARTDLFSLGLVLYEMATGRRAFDGRSAADISAAILAKEPVPLHALRPDLPTRIEDAIVKTLEKDRELRCQTASELRTDFRRLKAQSTAGPQPMPAPGSPPVSRATEPTSSDAVVALELVRRHRGLAIAAGVIAVAAAGLAGSLWYHAGRAEGVGSAAFPNLEVTPISSGAARFPAISPDGKFVAFRRQGALWVKQVGSDNAVQLLPAITGRTYYGLTITPDGQAVDYVLIEKQDTSLWRIPLLGGPSRPLVKDISSAVGWSADGKRMAFLRSKGMGQETAVVVADASGQNQSVITVRRPPSDFFKSSTVGWPVDLPAARPAWSGDGGTLFLAGFSAAADRADSPFELVSVDVATRQESRVSILDRGLYGVAWLDGSHLLVEGGDMFHSGLWATDLAATVWTPLTRQLTHLADANLAADRKTVAAQTAERRSGIWITDAAGGNRRLIAPDTSLWGGGPFIDDHGDVTYHEMALDGRFTIYRARTEDRRVIVGGVAFPYFAVSGDGRTVVFNRSEVGMPLYRINSDGSGQTKLVDRDAFAPAIVPDGSVLFASEGHGLFSVPLQGGTPRTISNRTPLSTPQVSFDGTHVLFVDELRNVVVCRLPDCTESQVLPTPAGFSGAPRWMPDAKGISYINAADHRNIWVQAFDGSPPHALTHLDDARIFEFCWSRDGKSMAISHGQWNEDIVLIKGLR